MPPDDSNAPTPTPYATLGFVETDLAPTTEMFGQVAHVFSTYEARHAPADKPFMRGVNSIQLVHDGKRWYVLNLVWRAEDAKLQLPERYLRNG
jgi:hypothetical protein